MRNYIVLEKVIKPSYEFFFFFFLLNKLQSERYRNSLLMEFVLGIYMSFWYIKI